jgi:putative DNA primase/helicase
MTVQQLQQLLQVKQSQQITFTDLKPTGYPLSTIDNLQCLLTHYGIIVKYNEMSKEIEIDIPQLIGHKDVENNTKIALIRNYANLHNFPVMEIDNYILAIAAQRWYHPVRDYIDSQLWDKVDRLNDYYNSIILDDVHPMKEVIMRKWALSLVAALYHPQFSCEGVLTFSGEQGKGKTIWIENLIPQQFHNIWNKDAVVIDTRNKDSLTKALKFWIAELGELDATFKRSDIEALKGFITEKVDIIRNPYERKANTYSRRTVFYATVNDEEFLRDNQNRRFWVLPIKEFRHGTIDVGQFWAQIKTIYMSVRNKISTGADREKYQEWGWFMSPSERKLMEPLQERYKTIDPVEETLERYVEVAGDGEFMNCTEILQKCSFGMPNKQHTTIASKWFKKNGYERNARKQWKVKMKSLLDEEKVVSFDRFKRKSSPLL